MNKTNLQEKLQYFKDSDETINVELYFLYQEQGHITVYLPAAEENKLSVSLGTLVKSMIRNKFFNDNEDYQYEIVSANTAEANNIKQVFHISKNDIPKATTIFESVLNNAALDFPKNKELENVWAYIFKVDSFSGGTIYLFKKNYPVNVLRKEKSYGVIFTNNKLSLFDKDLLRLSKHFDVMLIESELIILNRSEFEKAFDYVGAMQASASIKVDAIKKTGLIEDLEKIKSLSSNKRTLRKLLNINSNSKVLLKTPTQIIRLAKKYKVEFTATEDGSQLTINTKKAAIAFVDMLNDDFLKSEFSGGLYKINGKSSIS